MGLLQNALVHSLEEKIKDASQKYYSDGSSPYTDAEFDAMMRQLKELCPTSPLLNQTGHGYDIDESTTPGDKFTHLYQEAGSLGKAYSWDEINKDLRDCPVEISLKLDGISMVLYYKEGKLLRAVTRGNGKVGIDVTDKMLKIVDPELHDTLFTGAVRGEVIMTQPDWEQYSKQYPDAKNARNSAAGIVGGKTTIDRMPYLSFIPYTIVGIDPSNYIDHEDGVDYWFTYLPDIHEWLISEYGVAVPCRMFDSLSIIQSSEYADIYSFSNIHHDLICHCSNEYPNDGLVIKYAHTVFEKATQANLYTAQAYKFDAESAETEVEDIEWSLTKTGYYMPKARLKTVELSGTNVSYATCFHAQWVKENRLGKGAIVRVSKHGEIIPAIDEVVEPVEYPTIPYSCPACGQPFTWEGVHLHCQNASCPNAVEQDLLIWLDALAPVDGFGDLLRLKFLKEVFGDEPITIQSVMAKGYAGLVYGTGGDAQYQLFVQMCDKLFNQKINAVDAIKALNIPRFGEKTADKLGTNKYLFEQIWDIIGGRPYSRFDVWFDFKDQLGEANANAFFDNLYKVHRLNLIKDRIQVVAGLDDANQVECTSKGKVCVTGKLSVPRSQFESELKAAGWVLGELTKDTKFLITDNPSSGTSKNAKADKLGIVKITEEEFRKEHM